MRTAQRREQIQKEYAKKQPLCACGCGEAVGWAKCGGDKWNKYIKGHNMRGNAIWEGRKHTEETKRKMSIASAGIIISEETRRRISKAQTGKKATDETKKKMSAVRKGVKHSAKHIENLTKTARANREKTSAIMIELWKDPAYRATVCAAVLRGENNPNWKGGTSAEPYCWNWDSQEFKDIIKSRDDYKCQNPSCWGNSKILNVHHIDYVKKNCDLLNLITICCSCNGRANYNRDDWQMLYEGIMTEKYRN